jgi:hypothetical protein
VTRERRDTLDRAHMSDELRQMARYARDLSSGVAIIGWGTYELRDVLGHIKQFGTFLNLITQIGDEYYGERAAGIASPPDQVTGMRLGTGTTAPAKTGAGAAIVTYVTASNKAVDGGFPTSALSGSSRRIQWKTTWNAGEATANDIAEAVLTNETPLTNVAGAASNTVSRALLSPTVNKGASDTLALTWNHDLLGA